MPTYEYRCTVCANLFELFQKMNDEPIKHCPKCNGEVKRLIGTGAGTIFKGKGFYQTDYKNSSSATTTSGSSKNSNDAQTKPSEKKSVSPDKK